MVVSECTTLNADHSPGLGLDEPVHPGDDDTTGNVMVHVADGWIATAWDGV